METILNYLENMFMNLPKTDEVMRAKSELASMMEDKYNELLAEGKTDNEAVGVVISEFGNLKELAEELGLSSIYENTERYENRSARMLSDDEVSSYLDDTKKYGNGISIGVLFCICSPIFLLLLGGMNRGITDYTAGIGVCVLLVMVAIGVGIIIYHATHLEKYEGFKKEEFTVSSQTLALLKSREAGIRDRFIKKIITGVVLCICSVMPLILVGTMNGMNETDETSLLFTVVLMLLIIAVAVYLFITGAMEMDTMKVLLQVDEFSVKSKRQNKISEKIGSIYWPITACIYLAWSFLTFDWHITWLVWPIAGVLFAAISAICAAIEKEEK